MKIPIELKPFSDEILSSWLIRNSIACGSDPSSWVSGIWLNFRVWTRDIDRHLPTDKIIRLSKITSLSVKQIRNMTLEPIIEKIISDYSLNPNKAWFFIVPTGSRSGKKINGTHFCKDCFKEKNPYVKKQWRLAWNVACPIHEQLLIYKCQKCNEAFAPHLIDYKNTQIFKCTYCGYDLRLSTSVDASKEVIQFQENLNRVAFGDVSSIDFPIIKYSIDELFKTIRILISFFRYAIYSEKHKNILKEFNIYENINTQAYSKGISFESMAIEDRCQLLYIVSKLSKFNLDEIEKIFSDNNIHQKALLNQISLSTKTINKLAKNLIYTKARAVLVDKSKSIKPKSKTEVEKLMNEIRKFI